MIIKKVPKSYTPPNTQQRFNIIISTTSKALLFYLISMSMLVYKVIGAPKCPKFKKQLGLKITPIIKTKETYYSPGDSVIYECGTNESKQTIKCLDDGRWSELPDCPDPSNNTCPSLEPMKHGYFNATGPAYKVNTVVEFRCENEILSAANNATASYRKPKDLKDESDPTNQSLDGQKYTIPTTINSNSNEIDAISITTTTTATSQHQTSSTFKSELAQPIFNNSSRLTFSNDLVGSFENPISTSAIKYNLTGSRTLRCLPSSKWNHDQPKCVPVLPEHESNSSLILTSAIIVLIPAFVFFLIAQLFLRWRKRQQQRERWKQYFTDYKYRHSKTSITFGTRPNQNPTIKTTIPVTDL